MASASEVLVPNSLFHQWDLLAVLAIFLLAFVQAVYFAYRRKPKDVEVAYLTIRERLAGYFQRTLIAEARAVFADIDYQLPAALMGSETGEDRSRFRILLDGIARMEGEDDQSSLMESLVQTALGNIVVDRVNSLLSQAESNARARIDGAELSAEKFNVTFAEHTVGDLVRLSGAMQQTRAHRDRFFSWRSFAMRTAPVAFVAFLACFAAMLLTFAWAYWAVVASISVFTFAGLGVVYGAGAALSAVHWLEEMAESADSVRRLLHRQAEPR